MTLTNIGAGLSESVLIQLRLRALACNTNSRQLLLVLLTLDAVLTPLFLDPLLDSGRVFLLSLTLQTLETLPRVPPTARAWTWSLRLKRLDRINKTLELLISISDRNPILLN